MAALKSGQKRYRRSLRQMSTRLSSDQSRGQSGWKRARKVVLDGSVEVGSKTVSSLTETDEHQTNPEDSQDGRARKVVLDGSVEVGSKTVSSLTETDEHQTVLGSIQRTVRC